MSLKYGKIAVTGGAGFIGSHLVDRLLSEGYRVIVLDNLSTGTLQNIENHKTNRDFEFRNCDIRRPRQLKRNLEDVDAVFHEAAISSVEISVKNPAMINAVNVNGTLNVLTTSMKCSVKRLVYASSAAVYGNTDGALIDEETPTNPLSPYGVSKLAAEHYVRAFYQTYGFETVCLRYFNVYGPRQERSPYSSVITRFLDNLSKRQSLRIHGDGKQTRDFVHVKDVVEANMLALEGKRAAGEVFNIGTGKSLSINELAMTLRRIEGPKLTILHSPPRTMDVRYSCADISKAEDVLNFVPKYEFQQEAAKLVKTISPRDFSA